jgi:MFS family permease
MTSIRWISLVPFFLLFVIQLGQCSITVITPEDIAGQIFTPTPQYAIGLQEFNVTAEVVVADPIDGCELRNNVTGKIVLAIMDEALCLADIIMNAVLEANGLAVILHYDGISSLDTFTFSRALTERIQIGAVALSNDHWNILSPYLNSTDEPIIVTVTSGDFNEYAYTATLPSFWVLYILLALVGLSVTIYGLVRLIGYIRFYGPQFSIAQVALSLQTLSAAITVIAASSVIAHLNYWPMPDAAYFTLYGLGPLLMVFSTILVGLFWSGLIWSNKKERFWNKYLFGVILAVLLVLFAVNILSNIFFRGAVWALLVLIVIIALIVGLYFVIIGSILVHQIIKNSRKLNIVSKKSRYPQRLVKMLILTGVSMILFVLVSMLTISPLYTLNAGWNLFVLSMTQFFTMTTVAAEITLFKNVKTKPKSASGSGAAVSSTNTGTDNTTSTALSAR